MQELSIPSQSASPYTPVGGGNTPSLGTPIPGTTGGLPQTSGLSVFNNPLPQPLQDNPQQTAQQMQQYGRGEDTMLVHMTPEEVNSLQGLAMASGGSLTINPHTGLPEAGWLGKLLPTILGFAGAAVGLPTWALALGGAAGGTAITGDLKQGLMAGLGAWGGASLAGGLGVGKAGELAAKGATSAGADAAKIAVTRTPGQIAQATQGVLNQGAGSAAQGATGFLGKFSNAARAGLPGGIIGKAAPYVAGMGLMGAVSDATQPNMPKYTGEEQSKTKYEGPYRSVPRKIAPRFEGTDEGEITFFDEVNPIGYMTASGERRGFAEGGDVSDEELSDSYKALEARINAANEASQGNSIAADYARFLGGASNKLKNAIANRTVSNMDLLNSLVDNKKTGWVGLDALGEDFKPVTGAADKYAHLAMTSGFVDPITGQTSRLADPSSNENLKVGTTTNSGNKLMRLNENRQWETVGDSIYNPTTWVFDEGRVDWAKHARPQTSTTPPTGGLGSLPPGNKPPEEKISVDTLKTTIDPTMGGVTPGSGTAATLTDRPDIPGATYDSPGVQTLKETYTPKFTEKEDFVTKANPAYTLGTEMEALLPSLTSRYSTSPGAVTAMNGYSGGSPSERIRAAVKARMAAAAAAPATTPGTAAPATAAGTGGYAPFDFSGNTFFTNMMASNAAPPTAAPASTPASNLVSGGAAPFQMDTSLGADTGSDMGGEMNYGFSAPSAPAANPAALVGTDDFWAALMNQNAAAGAAPSYGYYGGGTSGGRYGDNQYVREYADGGPVDMQDGAFVVDARTVSELGNGSSNAGMELLQRLGGRPLNGPGDGVSDSIRARIGGKQEARVARDEVIMPPEAVRRIGGGNEKRGTQKLYALMDRAHKARKKAKRGQDTKLARGLGALA